MPSELDYSPLRERPRLTRGSGGAIALYASTAVVGLLLLILVPLYAEIPFWFFLCIGILLAVQLAAVQSVIKRRDTTQPDDIWAFAAANDFRISGPCDPSDLGARVTIWQQGFFGTHQSGYRWPYDVPRAMTGNYRGHVFTCYDITLAEPRFSDSSIEQDMHFDSLTHRDAEATITFRLPYQTAQSPPRIAAGVTIWERPDITPKQLKRIWRRSGVIDVQTDGERIAILWVSHLPYDRRGMQYYFATLDCAVPPTTTK